MSLGLTTIVRMPRFDEHDYRGQVVELCVRSGDLVEAGHLRQHRERDVLFGLNADDQLVGLDRRSGSTAIGVENRVRHIGKPHYNFGHAFGQAFAGAKVEGHALPSPIVDLCLDRDEGFGVRAFAQLLVIARDRLASDCAGAVLASDGFTL